jgi:ABC-2 type transport system ATP-binding protein
MTVLLTTHDMEEAEVLCDELAILHAGVLAVSGRPEELRAAISATATLDDVFARWCGGTIEQGGGFAGTRETRATARRLG